jgi:hypothetical protein
MSFIRPGQGGGYSRIPSAIPENTRKMAASLDEVLETWDNRDEIKYQEPRPTNPSGSYYSDSQQPEGLLESGSRFFVHLADPDARALHSQGIEAVVKDLKNQSTFPAKGVFVEGDFKLRKMLGQPLSVGALRQSIAQATPDPTTPQVPPQPTKSTDSCPTSPFSLFGKGKNSKDRESAVEIIAKDLKGLKENFPLSGKNGYQRIPEDESSKPPAQRFPTKQRTSSYPYQARPALDPNKPSLQADDFPPAEDGITLQKLKTSQKQSPSPTSSGNKPDQAGGKTVRFDI